MKLQIINGKVVLLDQIINANVLIEDGIITEISDQIYDCQKIDASGNYVCPGLVDIHTHGKKGQDTMYATQECLDILSKSNLETGVTSFLPTTMTYDLEITKKVVDLIRNHKVHDAKILGLHLEGPFINENFKGAQPLKYIYKPSIETYDYITSSSSEAIRLITLAPEKEGADRLIEYLQKQGVVVSIGHTGCTYEQAVHAIELGVHHFTHSFNAMSKFSHREPNCVGAILNHKMDSELILDGIHVSIPACQILYQCVGEDHLILITDSIEACMLDEGIYQLGGQKVTVKDKKAVLDDGTIAGSVLCLNEAVKNAMDYLHVPLYTAIKMASYNPARAIGEEKKIGSIEVGKIGDIIIIDDNVHILHAIVEGEIKF